jgi:hypothetical protein
MTNKEHSIPMGVKILALCTVCLAVIVSIGLLVEKLFA